MKLSPRYIAICTLPAVFGCRKPYDPPAINSAGSYMIVEGQIDSADSTIINLGRTVNVSNKNTYNPITGAIVSVEGDQGINVPLLETKPGRYAGFTSGLDNMHNYRLSIKTNNEQYLSD